MIYDEQFVNENDLNATQSQYMSIEDYNFNKKDTNIHLIGDRIIICQITQLLAYIKHAINNHQQTSITVNINNTVANPTLLLDVNGMQIPDLVTQSQININ